MHVLPKLVRQATQIPFRLEEMPRIRLASHRPVDEPGAHRQDDSASGHHHQEFDQ
jgi:hypothetical protein